MLIELDRTTPIIVDRSLYRELCKQAISRTVEDLQPRAADLAKQRQAGKASGRAVDPDAEARRERARKLRALADQAHGANLDLGSALMNGLAVVDAANDMNVARVFVLCGHRHRTNYADGPAMPNRVDGGRTTRVVGGLLGCEDHSWLGIVSPARRGRRGRHPLVCSDRE